MLLHHHMFVDDKMAHRLLHHHRLVCVKTKSMDDYTTTGRLLTK